MMALTNLDVILPAFHLDMSRVDKLSQICLAFHRTRTIDLLVVARFVALLLSGNDTTPFQI